MKHVALQVFGFLFVGGLALLCTVWMIAAVGHGEYPTAVVAFAFAVALFGVLACGAKASVGAVTARVAVDRTGTTIRPDRVNDALMGVALIGLEIGMGLGAILALADRLDIPLDDEDYHSVGIAAVLAVFGLPALWRHFARGTYLRLTPRGFEIAQGRAVAGSWGEVDDITDTLPSSRLHQPSAIVMEMSDGARRSLIARSFTPHHGRALRELVRFYWQHPEHRGELTNGRAADRLAGERFAA
ncbi:hypothetical protein [Mycobacterium talmoniae]|uniref:Uncharacterized protein n=1 Tax=Mycobacterium talmoniae TaxID=1858794 RepID=A0A1S1NJU9_9MYCO|nr:MULTISPECIES: hypothetical protein [Mycobacterium]OHV03454.1 hypothetical protein BKN37_14930 [Mycobacterium talmoniae]PQM49245.1 hypothetical protein C1Y40_00532 [Mycobacterium talmoniae]TDH49848.1 hypothetical protein E2F47_19470 [Mycobacterium eburneum]